MCCSGLINGPLRELRQGYRQKACVRIQGGAQNLLGQVKAGKAGDFAQTHITWVVIGQDGSGSITGETRGIFVDEF